MLTRIHRIFSTIALVVFVGAPAVASEPNAAPATGQGFEVAHAHFRDGRGLQRLHRNTPASRIELVAAFNGYQAVVAADPTSATAARALYMSGSTKLFLDQPDEAVAIYQEVVERYPGDRYYVAKSLVKMSSVEKNNLEPEAARRSLKRYHDEFPDAGPKDLQKEVGRIQTALAMIGKPAPSIEAARWFNAPADGTGGDGAVSVLYFWATWCPNCKKEVEFINGLWSRYKDRGLRLVGVTKNTRGQTDETVEKYIQTNGFSFPIAIDAGGKTSLAMGVGSVPTAVVIDRSGRIRWLDHPAALSDAVLDRLLKTDFAENR